MTSSGADGKLGDDDGNISLAASKRVGACTSEGKGHTKVHASTNESREDARPVGIGVFRIVVIGAYRWAARRRGGSLGGSAATLAVSGERTEDARFIVDAVSMPAAAITDMIAPT
jgi:hypothetical protein